MKYDLIIIGAGVATSSALIALKNAGLQIAVVAPGGQSDFKIGETLAPAGWMELQQLGISDDIRPSDHWPSFQKFSSWGTSKLLPSTNGGHQSWYLNRVKFERTLWDRAQQTVLKYFDTKATHVDKKQDLWCVKTKAGELHAKIVLDASGRASVAGRHHFNRIRHDKLVALYAILEQSDEEVEPTRATMIEARPNGWFYSVLIPGNRMVVSWFTDSDLLPKGLAEQKSCFLNQVHESEFTNKRITSAGYQLNTEIQNTDASTIITNEFSKNNLVLAGDAAVCFDPLSSHGITTALWSGRKSGKAIASLLKQDSSALSAYARSFRLGTEKYLKEKQHIYQIERRFSTEVFWRRRNGELRNPQA